MLGKIKEFKELRGFLRTAGSKPNTRTHHYCESPQTALAVSIQVANLIYAKKKISERKKKHHFQGSLCTFSNKFSKSVRKRIHYKEPFTQHIF